MDIIKQLLPQGLYARSNSLKDIPQLLPMINGMTKFYTGVEEETEESLRVYWEGPTFNIHDCTQTVYNVEGKPLGHLTLWKGMSPVRPFLWLRIAPEYSDSCVTDYLVAYARMIVEKDLPTVPRDARVSLTTSIDSRIGPLVHRLKILGFSEFRYQYKMLIEMDKLPPEPIIPEGVILNPFEMNQAEVVYHTREAIFKDHFGFIEQPFEKGFAHFMHFIENRTNSAPGDWIIAWDKDEIAGICLVDKHLNAVDNEGYIDTLGVSRNWRKKGLGLAMLHQAFRNYYQKGIYRVSLHVDTLSLTGATRLYKKAGMYVAETEKELELEVRPGKELSVQELAE